MKCSEFHELAAGYVVGALPEEELLACRRHLRDEGPHDGCEAIVARYERVTAALTELIPHQPVSPRIWRAIEARLGVEANIETAPMTMPRTRVKPAPRWREALAWTAAAAALVAALWTREHERAATRTHEAVQARSEQTLTALAEERMALERAQAECTAALVRLQERGAVARDAVSLLEHPATKIVPMAPTGAQPYQATALYNAETHQALVISSSIAPVAGKDFELWVIPSGQPTPLPAGFLRFDASGVALGALDVAVLANVSPAALAVSLEPEGGRPTPTEVVLLAKIGG